MMMMMMMMSQYPSSRRQLSPSCRYRFDSYRQTDAAAVVVVNQRRSWSRCSHNRVGSVGGERLEKREAVAGGTAAAAPVARPH